MKNGILILAGALLLVPATPLAAQSLTSHPASERGNHSLSLSLYGGPQIGYWVRKSGRTDLGVDFGASGMFHEDNTTFSLTATPALKRYLAPAGALAPYTYIGAPFTYGRSTSHIDGSPDDSHSSVVAGGIVGLGLDWFPVRQVSIGGHAGLTAYYWKPEGDESTLVIQTLTSGVRVQFYF